MNKKEEGMKWVLKWWKNLIAKKKFVTEKFVR